MSNDKFHYPNGHPHPKKNIPRVKDGVKWVSQSRVKK